MSYSIYAESTPNPEVMKFVANRMLWKTSIEIKSKEVAKEIPIAKELFKFPFIKSLYLNKNFISVTKNDSIKWEDCAMQLREHISNFLNNFSQENTKNNVEFDIKENTKSKGKERIYSDTEKEIINILNEYIAPAIEADGGSITLDSYSENKVYVNLSGACNGCPSATSTLKQGVETLLRQKINDKIIVISNQ